MISKHTGSKHVTRGESSSRAEISDTRRPVTTGPRLDERMDHSAGNAKSMGGAGIGESSTVRMMAVIYILRMSSLS